MFHYVLSHRAIPGPVLYNSILDRYPNTEFSVVLNLHPDLHDLHSLGT